MISSYMHGLGNRKSVIREIFEYAKVRGAEIGPENVFDFSIGNPNVPAPDCVRDAIAELIAEPDSPRIHGYTSAPGDMGVRRVISDSINRRFGTALTPECLYMTCGAAGALTICMNALYEDGDEFITFAPFFTEYRVFVESTGASLKVVSPHMDDFQIDVDAFESAITPHTKGVIVNSPNNPSGVVYSAETIARLAEVMRKKSAEYGHPIFLICDEPYREIVYDGVEVPYMMNFYDETLVCYSYSKSLSLPGERIGYLLVSNKFPQWRDVLAAVYGAGRALGYVNAPHLFQLVVEKCEGATADVSVYARNRDLLYDSLTAYGFTCVRPDGAFYLFVKSPSGDAFEFYERGKQYELLFVPGDDFGCPGYVRIAYCVQTETIERALPGFKKLAESYR